MIENLVLDFGAILFNGYLVCVILNIFLSPKFSIDKLKVQNLIGISFCLGFLFTYIVFIYFFLISWYSGSQVHQFSMDYSFTYILTLIALLLNIRKKYRLKLWVIIISSLTNLLFIIEYIQSIISPGQYPESTSSLFIEFLKYILYGIILYFSIIVILKLNKHKSKIVNV